MDLDFKKNSAINAQSIRRFRRKIKWVVPLLLVFAFLTGCSTDSRDEIEGRWRTSGGSTFIEFFDDGTARLEGREVTFDLEYSFIDDSQVRLESDAGIEEVWEYKANSETLSLTSADGQSYTKIQVVDWRFARRIVPTMLEGLWVTVRATFFGFFFALLFGFMFALGRRSQYRLISFPTGFIIDFTRSTPLLIQLFFFFFVLPKYGFSLPPFQLGVIAIGLHYGTYCSEVYRAGIDGVPQGQWEVATALNLSPQRKWLAIILPQAIPPMIPAFGNYLVAMFKETAQLSVITVVELLFTARGIGTREFRFLEPITMAGFMYFMVSFPASLIVQRLENYFGRKD